jgi:hypothetical protein
MTGLPKRAWPIRCATRRRGRGMQRVAAGAQPASLAKFDILINNSHFIVLT